MKKSKKVQHVEYSSPDYGTRMTRIVRIGTDECGDVPILSAIIPLICDHLRSIFPEIESQF
ncbi:MAG: hypothetical protein ACFCU6_15550 [Balneolaceae bacterium]